MADPVESPLVAAMRRRLAGAGAETPEYMAPMPQEVRGSQIDLIGDRIKQIQAWRNSLPVDVQARKGGASLILRGKF